MICYCYCWRKTSCTSPLVTRFSTSQVVVFSAFLPFSGRVDILDHLESSMDFISPSNVWKNRDTPKWMVNIMKNSIKMDDLGWKPTIFGKPPNKQWLHNSIVEHTHQKTQQLQTYPSRSMPKGEQLLGGKPGIKPYDQLKMSSRGWNWEHLRFCIWTHS